MSAPEKIERLIDLIGLLLETRRPLQSGEIREKIPGYREDSEEAFHRKFERDKTELRELGFPLEQVDAGWGEPGYTISAAEALLDDPGLTQDEMAALALAARAWGGGSGDGAIGLLKLSVGTTVTEPVAPGWLLPRVDVDRAVTALFDAVTRRKVVRFTYRSGGASASEEREVEPYRVSHQGAWYLTGFDRGRKAVRHFKLSRVEGKIAVGKGKEPDFAKPDIEIEEPRAPWEAEPVLEARIAFAPEIQWSAGRRTGARRVAERDDGWVEIGLPVGDMPSFAAWLCGFADRAEALAPPELRAEMAGRLRALAGEA